MPRATTSLPQKLELADRSPIRDAMLRLKGEFEAGRWLGLQKPYRTNIAAIRDNTEVSDCRPHHELIEYIAVSSILHCFDGWSYLGHALQSEMALDPDAARHLGYYAELRAAMSLLASEGIGVFNNTHVVVCSKGTCHSINGSTHQFVWKALENWADTRAKDVLLRVVIVNGVGLSDWLDTFSSGGVQELAADWLKSWGLDLKRYTEDRDARNTASYRPTALESSGPRPIEQIMSTVVQLWSVCEPTDTTGFDRLDRWLFRSILEEVFRSSRRKSARAAPNAYLKQVDGMLDNQGSIGAARERLRQLLDPKSNQVSAEILSDARGTLSADSVDHSKQLIARAALLLRLATGCARELIADAEAEPYEMLQFWWSKPTVRRGLWPAQSPPSSFSDLWEDVGQALDDVAGWLSGSGADPCAYDFWRKHAAEASVLSTTERICLWGLGL